MIEDNRYTAEQLEEMLLQQLTWRHSEQRKLSAEEEKMEWFIHCKNEVAGDANPDVSEFNVKNLIFNISRKTIGYDLSSSFDYSYINKIVKQTSKKDMSLSIEPIHLNSDVSLKNNVSRYINVDSMPLTATDPKKMYIILPTI